MLVQSSAPRPVRRTLLAGLVLALVAALVAAGWPLGVPGAAAAPMITLFPDRGPCATRPEVRGTGFPAGATIAVFTQRTSPPGEKAAQQIAEATADRDGRFRVTLLVINGDCIDLDARTPDGTRYTFTAAVANTDGGPAASAVYTIDRRVPANIRCYGETNHCVQGLFRGYWLAHGLDLGDPGISERESLALFGYPISDEFEQRLEDGRTYRVQYFERARMEHHPENPPPYDVLLGQFGRRVLSAFPDAPTAPVAPQPGMTHFAVTGHNVGPRFMAYWRANGGLETFGYPLTEPFDQRLEDGQVYTVQYFERARFELHPEHPAPYQVELGQFGRLILGPTGGPNLP